MLLSRFFLPHLAQLPRQRIAICASFFIQGLLFATWTSRIPDVRALFHLDNAQLGLLLLMMSLGQIVGMPFNGWLVTRFGSKRMAITAGYLYGAVIFSLGLVSAFLPGTTLGRHLFGGILFAGGFISALSYTAVNTQGVQLEKCYGRSIMTFFHAMWSMAGFVAVGIAMIVGCFHLAPQYHFMGIGLATAILLTFTGGALRVDPPFVTTTTADAKRPSMAWRFTPVMLLLGLTVLGCMLCEGAIYEWNGIWMRDVVKCLATQEKTAYMAFLAAMVATRFVTDALVERFGVKTILFFSSLLLFLGFFIMIAGAQITLGHTPFLMAVIGCASIGIGASTMTPLCCALAGKLKSMPPGIAIAEISTIGAMGFLIAPPVIGVVSKLFNLKVAFGLMGLMAFFTILATLFLFRCKELKAQ
ncbi:MAG: MFS transporter [bacterium]|nr:MFS transporter [bacterium]